MINFIVLSFVIRIDDYTNLNYFSYVFLKILRRVENARHLVSWLVIHGQEVQATVNHNNRQSAPTIRKLTH